MTVPSRQVGDATVAEVAVTDLDLQRLAEHAWQVRAHARILGATAVGCAVLGGGGGIWRGCNVEHGFRSHDVHAEVNAISSMVSDGERTLRAVVVAAERERFSALRRLSGLGFRVWRHGMPGRLAGCSWGALADPDSQRADAVLPPVAQGPGGASGLRAPGPGNATCRCRAWLGLTPAQVRTWARYGLIDVWDAPEDPEVRDIAYSDAADVHHEGLAPYAEPEDDPSYLDLARWAREISPEDAPLWFDAGYDSDTAAFLAALADALSRKPSRRALRVRCRPASPRIGPPCRRRQRRSPSPANSRSGSGAAHGESPSRRPSAPKKPLRPNRPGSGAGPEAAARQRLKPGRQRRTTPALHLPRRAAAQTRDPAISRSRR